MGLRDWIYRIGGKSRRLNRERLAAIDAELNQMSADEARRLVEQILLSGEFFRTQSATGGGPLERLAELAETAAPLFQTYSVVESNSMRLSHNDIGPFSGRSGAFVVGSDMDGAPVVVERNSGRVYVVDAEEGGGVAYDEQHPSIWHYLLYVYRTAQQRG